VKRRLECLASDTLLFELLVALEARLVVLHGRLELEEALARRVIVAHRERGLGLEQRRSERVIVADAHRGQELGLVLGALAMPRAL